MTPLISALFCLSVWICPYFDDFLFELIEKRQDR